jgi:hypothetical protein
MANKIINKLHVFIDDSGNDYFPKDNIDKVHFSLCATLIEDKNLSLIDNKFKDFRDKFSKIFGLSIPYLHSGELEDGLKGKGTFKILQNNPKLANEFFSEMEAMVKKLPFKMASVAFNLVDYRVWWHEVVWKIRPEYKGPIPNDNKSAMFILNLRFLAQYIRLEPSIFNYDEFMFYVEHKYLLPDNEIDFINRGVFASFRSKKVSVFPSVTKGSQDYHSGFELSDLYGNPLKKIFEDPKKRTHERSIVQEKVILNHELTFNDFKSIQYGGK